MVYAIGSVWGSSEVGCHLVTAAEIDGVRDAAAQLQSSELFAEKQELLEYFGLEKLESLDCTELTQFVNQLESVVERALLTVSQSPAREGLNLGTDAFFDLSHYAVMVDFEKLVLLLETAKRCNCVAPFIAHPPEAAVHWGGLRIISSEYMENNRYAPMWLDQIRRELDQIRSYSSLQGRYEAVERFLQRRGSSLTFFEAQVCFLSAVPVDALKYMSAVRIVSMGGNLIASLPQGFLRGHKTICSLQISNNCLESIPADIAANAPELSEVVLTNNPFLVSLPQGLGEHWPEGCRLLS